MKQLWTTCKYVSQSPILLIYPISISNRRTQLESISTRKFAQKTSETLHQTRELIAIEALLLHHHQHVLYLVAIIIIIVIQRKWRVNCNSSDMVEQVVKSRLNRAIEIVAGKS